MNRTLKVCFISLSVTALSIASCSKEENKNSLTNDSAIQLANEKALNERVIKFVAITTGVSQNEVYLDKESNNFIIRKTVKLNRDTILKRYEEANVYKDQYEKAK